MKKTLSSKLINDPVYGFIPLKFKSVEQIVAHPYFQRLRLIKQLSLASLVYPGAVHTRFNHSLGAMHLMHKVLNTLTEKGFKISEEEFEAAMIATLLHDIGHGPFSHACESAFVASLSHEDLSLSIMEKLNKSFSNKLDLALEVFTNKYYKKFFNKLISSQLDVDRMDYLNRDSFFTGVADGIINFERLIATLTLYDHQIVLESKGLNSLENFMISRYIMYWQVYLHKTVIAAEHMLIKIINRAKDLFIMRNPPVCTEPLRQLLCVNITKDEFFADEKYLTTFLNIDDTDLWVCIKTWQNHSDVILSTLCKNLVNRKLYKIIVQEQPLEPQQILDLKKQLAIKYAAFQEDDFSYALSFGELSNDFYNLDKADEVQILVKGKIEKFSANSVISGTNLFKGAKKYFLCNLPL